MSIATEVLSKQTYNRYLFNNQLSVDAYEIMWVNGRWERAYMAKVGDMLFDPLTGRNVTITSISVTNYTTPHTVYDIFGSPVNNFIADGFLIDLKKTKSGSISGTAQVMLWNGKTMLAQDLKPGDVVLGYNTHTDALEPTVVISTFQLIAHDEYIINNGSLIVDSGEPLFINGSWNVTKTLKVGDMLFDPLANRSVRINSITIINGTFPVYEQFSSPLDDIIANGFLAK